MSAQESFYNRQPESYSKTEVDLKFQNLLMELKSEIQVSSANVRREISEIRSEIHAEIQELRSEIHTEIQGLRSETHGEIQGLRAEMNTRFEVLQTNMTWIKWITGAILLLILGEVLKYFAH